MANELVTVIGGSGFVGRHLVRTLAARGMRVRVAVRHPDDARPALPAGSVGQISVVRANIRDDTSVLAAVEGADAVVNLVGILRKHGRQTFEAVHRHGAARVARLAAVAKVARLVQISAIGADPESRSEYARTKAAGEAAARTEFPGVTIVRPSVVFGAEDKFFNLFAALARLLPVLPVFVRGLADRDGPRFQPVFVDDVAAALAAIAATGAHAGKTFELGGPEVLTMREVLERVNEYTGRDRPIVPWLLALARINATFLQMLPMAPLTRDQVRLLETDNVAAEGALGFADLGIAPTPVDAIVPAYLRRYRRAGAGAAAAYKPPE